MIKKDYFYWQGTALQNEISYKAVLAGGNGGQNVNKVSTKVMLNWDVQSSKLLSEEDRSLIVKKLMNIINNEGILQLTCSETRSQLENKIRVINKLYHLLSNCFKEKKPRKPTLPSYTSVKNRLETKTKKKTIKLNRRKPDW